MFNKNTEQQLLLINETLKNINHKLNTQQESLKSLHSLLFIDKDSIVSQLQDLRGLPNLVDQQEASLSTLSNELNNLKERANLSNKFLGIVATGLITIALPNILQLIVPESNAKPISISSAAAAAAAD